MFKNLVSFNMESFIYSVFESESLFSEFYHSRHGFFTRVPLTMPCPAMFLTLYSSIIIICVEGMLPLNLDFISLRKIEYSLKFPRWIFLF